LHGTQISGNQVALAIAPLLKEFKGEFMKKELLLAALVTLLPLTTARADGNRLVLSFETMYGVDGPFVNDASIRGVLGDELPWDIHKVKGSLSADGHLLLQIKGLVFSNDPSVPPEKRGTNDETSFRALVSCLVENGNQIGTANIMTAGFPATTTGDSTIDTTIAMPPQCVAPIIFVLSGSEAKWFAVTGAEQQ
jgi:hypothetical protein